MKAIWFLLSLFVTTASMAAENTVEYCFEDGNGCQLAVVKPDLTTTILASVADTTAASVEYANLKLQEFGLGLQMRAELVSESDYMNASQRKLTTFVAKREALLSNIEISKDDRGKVIECIASVAGCGVLAAASFGNIVALPAAFISCAIAVTKCDAFSESMDAYAQRIDVVYKQLKQLRDEYYGSLGPIGGEVWEPESVHNVGGGDGTNDKTSKGPCKMLPATIVTSSEGDEWHGDATEICH
ncbi:MAG: hypothetical protein EOP10_00490 [Proteobacteria bacterium]|nr:MAG: hypothetical protein EOP10_00490 [Pseudomonadota bacterium]